MDFNFLVEAITAKNKKATLLKFVKKNCEPQSYSFWAIRDCTDICRDLFHNEDYS